MDILMTYCNSIWRDAVRSAEHQDQRPVWRDERHFEKKVRRTRTPFTPFRLTRKAGKETVNR